MRPTRRGIARELIYQLRTSGAAPTARLDRRCWLAWGSVRMSVLTGNGPALMRAPRRGSRAVRSTFYTSSHHACSTWSVSHDGARPQERLTATPGASRARPGRSVDFARRVKRSAVGPSDRSCATPRRRSLRLAALQRRSGAPPSRLRQGCRWVLMLGHASTWRHVVPMTTSLPRYARRRVGSPVASSTIASADLRSSD